MARLALLLLGLMMTLGAHALDNGLARTPPMGWLSWERYRCNTDCTNQPDECISEKLYMAQADRMVSDGYRDAGYVYVNIDDCWPLKQRDSKGRLVPDPARFPSGMKALADYMHSRGLKLGIYSDMGTETCGGYPGSKFYLEEDAQTFADWGIDSLKLDGCYSTTDDFAEGYPIMGFFLNKTGRPILYSCSWPAYITGKGAIPPYKDIAKSCNLWRNYADIGDSWQSVYSIVSWFSQDKGNFTDVAGPGNWNDPDMLIVGNYGLSYDQQRVQMAIWAMMAAPMYMSNDLRNIRPESRDLLLNRRVIAINQDPRGIQGKRLFKEGNIELWVRPISPAGTFAIAVVNYSQGGGPNRVQLSLASFGLKGSKYNVTEVFDGKSVGVFSLTDKMTISVNPSGVFFAVAKGL
ncbi:alpha-N-acetylgalactosaminidase-like [Babylonia areolata]|uniref:alpha-N-acetylgalactosaminidase-like n=1 Tax=Babylonia areolata TaxID=304850 RepID=UPI003FD40761